MASLHISEFAALGETQQGDSIAVVDAGAHNVDQGVTIGGSSTQSNAFQVDSPSSFGPTGQALGSAALRTRWVLLTAGASCSIAFGANPTAVAGGWFMESGSQLLVRVLNGQKVAVITDTA